MKILKIAFICIIILNISCVLLAQEQKYDRKYFERKYRNCWKSRGQITLLDTVARAIEKNKIDDFHKQHDFIQTFGCSYEEDDIEQNSIRAVYRAVIQSIRNRHVELRDDLISILTQNPPRPDNLMREYSIYTNIKSETEKKSARYEIKILDLIAVPTIESKYSVWTRVVTRFAYKDDYNKVKEIDYEESEFIQVMAKAQEILTEIEHHHISDPKKILNTETVADVYPTGIKDLTFGDSMNLFDYNRMDKNYFGIYLGKGIIACETPGDGVVVCKFGEERLFGLLTDTNSFRRTTTIFKELNYQAPEVILECLLARFSSKKPDYISDFLDD